MKLKLILIEGIPGSGKSTLAEMLCSTAVASGLTASWFLEESKDHPVHPHNGLCREKTPEYFLYQWEEFVSSNINKDHLFILEGSLFQSTVRFIMEENGEAVIPLYFKQCESILRNCLTKLIYLRPPSISKHIDWVSSHRGSEWSSKVTSYLYSTPFCSTRNWREEVTLNYFWSYYAELCDSLVLETTIPKCTIEAGVGYFGNQYDQAQQFANLGQGYLGSE